MSAERLIETLVDDLRQIDAGSHLNERYLHHLFSRIVQQDYPVSLSSHSYLHPEWATYVDNVRIGGRYQKMGKEYRPLKSSGSPGFIDFVIGDVKKPDYAVEFKMSMHFNKEGIIYDYMKLLDGRNHFGKALSLAVYYGHSAHSKMCEAQVLTDCVKDAIGRLGVWYTNKPHSFIFVEVIDGAINKRFECNNSREFIEIK